MADQKAHPIENGLTPQQQSVYDAILRQWADKGRIVEGGWRAFEALHLQGGCVPRAEMRKAFMVGAQHLFASIMGILDSEREPTAQDLRRMELIHRELETFKQSLRESGNG